jgi:hypothetical protein
MANRQSSAWAAAQQDDRPDPRRDDALPEMNDDVRGRADDEDDDFDEDEEDEALDEGEETGEGSF